MSIESKSKDGEIIVTTGSFTSTVILRSSLDLVPSFFAASVAVVLNVKVSPDFAPAIDRLILHSKLSASPEYVPFS